MHGSVSLPPMDELAFAYLSAKIDDDNALLAWDIREEMHRRCGVEHTLVFINEAIETRKLCGMKEVPDSHLRKPPY